MLEPRRLLPAGPRCRLRVPSGFALQARNGAEAGPRVCLSLQKVRGERRRESPAATGAAEAKRVGLKKNLTPRTKGNLSVYFNSKTVPIFQAVSHLDESREDFCFPGQSLRAAPTTPGVVPSPSAPALAWHRHGHHTAAPCWGGPSGEEQEGKIRLEPQQPGLRCSRHQRRWRFTPSPGTALRPPMEGRGATRHSPPSLRGVERGDQGGRSFRSQPWLPREGVQRNIAGKASGFSSFIDVYLPDFTKTAGIRL